MIKYNGKDVTPKITDYFRTITEIYIIALIISQLDRWAFIHHVVNGKPMPFYRGMWFAMAIVLGWSFVYTFIKSFIKSLQEKSKEQEGKS